MKSTPSYFDVIACMRNLATPFAEEAGLHSSRSLIIITRQPSSPEVAIEVTPKPQITLLSTSVTNKLPRIEQVQFEADDFSVQGIPRTPYTYSYINRATTFLVDGEIVNGKAVNGISCSLVSISDGNALTWNLVLRRKGKRQ